MRTLLIFLAIALPSALKSQYFLEPYVGVALFGDGDATYRTAHDFSYYSLLYGGRVGYRYWGLDVGIDYAWASFDLEGRGRQGGSSKDKFSRQDWALLVGYRFPIFLSIWAKWIAQSNLEASGPLLEGGIYDHGDSFEGSGHVLGVGWTGLPWLSLNLEYRAVEYDEYTRFGSAVSNYRNTLDLTDFLFSISLPLEF